MDLRGIGKPVGPPPIQRRERVERSINTEKTVDREGNGQSSFGDGGDKHEPMSDEQFQKALEHLRGLQVVKDNHLEVLEIVSEEKRFVILKEPSGKIIRRISESELWTLQAVKDYAKGQFLSRSA